ncbi:response regulator [Halorubrum sp. JWXQ-INN 858]|uniref:ATP-binding response regulator n=1 Tax=Halorubrum sp. JWXQ-INN 858 TaxID=2690782 RepID=UPI00135AD070|nr:response regulator [Halorubrum sp. JWXQ-INN 858]MWV65638.1 response regulator [Halorubrum sp. JWXQ-INN 858]
MELLSQLIDSTPFEILLVEDSPDDVRLVEWTLSELPDPRDRSATDYYASRSDPMFSIEGLSTAGRLSDAVDHVSTEPTDVVLLDLDLPDSRGLDTLSEFIETTPPVPVVVLTGRDESELGVAAIQAGAQDYLYKGSLTNALLFRTIRYAVERHAIQHCLRDATERLRLTNRIARQQLQNDISVIIGQADQLSSSERPTDRSIASILDAAYDIEEVVDITAEFTETTVSEELSDVTPTIRTLVSTAVDRVEQRTGASIEMTRDADTTEIRCPPTLRIVLTQLLRDAVDRSVPSGTASIDIQPAESGLCVVITNTGSALPPDHAAFLSGPPENDEPPLRGRVGLQLVPMILSRVGYSVTVRDNEPSGSEIRLHLGGDRVGSV